MAAQIFAGVHREAGTPDPIPNSEVKLFIAHDTAYFMWESRPMPAFFSAPVENSRGLFACMRIDLAKESALKGMVLFALPNCSRHGVSTCLYQM